MSYRSIIVSWFLLVCLTAIVAADDASVEKSASTEKSSASAEPSGEAPAPPAQTPTEKPVATADAPGAAAGGQLTPEPQPANASEAAAEGEAAGPAPPPGPEPLVRLANFQQQPEAPAEPAGSNDTIAPPDYYLENDLWVEGGHLLPTRLFYVHVDYLNFWAKGMYVPPLVTTGADAPGLTLPDTTILFGNQDYLTNSRRGGRLRFGSDCSSWGCGGWEFELLGLPQDHLQFSVASNANGLPFLGRPFFNINPLDGNGDPDPPARQDAQLVSGTRTGELLRGRVTVDLNSSLVGAAARWRCQIGEQVGMLQVEDGGDLAYSSVVNIAAGYRYLRLSEGILIREDLTAVDLNNNNAETDIDIFDRFDTLNEFNGFDIGIEWLNAHRDWTMMLAGRIALGDVRQSVLIDGQTVNSGVGVGGLLAQTSNIGLHQRNVFSVVPELEARVSKRISDHISLSAGYNLIYWSRVARPGDQIDLDVNPSLIPPPVDPLTGPLRPEFVFRDSDYWVQGLTLGVNVEW